MCENMFCKPNIIIVNLKITFISSLSQTEDFQRGKRKFYFKCFVWRSFARKMAKLRNGFFFFFLHVLMWACENSKLLLYKIRRVL